MAVMQNRILYSIFIVLVCAFPVVVARCKRECRLNNPHSCESGYECQAIGSKRRCVEIGQQSPYYISTEGLSWDDAKMACEDMSGYLVIINDQEEHQRIRELDPAAGIYHIGIRCDNAENCEWIDGTRVEDGFTAWDSGEPNDYFDCGYIDNPNYLWRVFDCTNILPYICEIP